MNPPKPLQRLSDKEFAKLLGVHPSTVWRWRKSRPGFPQPVQFGPNTVRFKLVDVEAWMAAQEAA